MNTLKTKIDKADQEEWEKMSLKETMSLEETISDIADPQFLFETADMSIDPTKISDLKGMKEFDDFQVFNQNYITGFSDADLQDMYDPDNKGGHTTEGDKPMNEGIVPGGPGSLVHDFVTRSAADMNNPDIGIQTSDMPTAFSDVLTAGSMVRRPAENPTGKMAGVPENFEDILSGSHHGVEKAAQANTNTDIPEEYTIEDGVLSHPVGTHHSHALKEMNISFLLGEGGSSDNYASDNNDFLSSADEDSDDDDDSGVDDDDSDDDDGANLPDDFDTDSFLRSLESED